MIVIRQPLPAQHLARAERRGSVRTLRIGNLQKPLKRRLRAGGRTLKEIAVEMGLTREPVRQLIAAARRKLGMRPEVFEEKV